MAWIGTHQQILSESQSLNNAQMVINHFVGTDWVKDSLSAMCGNMRHESFLNPQMYELGKEWEEDRGYGLVQWTPRSKYWNWAVGEGLDPYSGDSQLARIDFEIANNIQWIADGHRRRYGLESKYDITFAQFRSNEMGYTVEELTEAFMWNYEGPAYSAGTNSLHDRRMFSLRCFNELDFTGTGDGGGGDPTDPPPTDDETATRGKALMHMYLAHTLNGWG